MSLMLLYITKITTYMSKIAHQSRTLAAMLLLTLAVLGNYYVLPLFFGVDFLFGSIFVMTSLILLDIPTTLAITVISSSLTVSLWGHPYAMLVLILETAFVLYYLKIKNTSMHVVMIDFSYWILLGMPLTVGLFHFNLNLDWTASLMVALKQTVNGIFNTLIASLLVIGYQLLFRHFKFCKQEAPKMQNVLFSTLLFSIIILGAIPILYGAQRQKTLEESQIKEKLFADDHTLNMLLKQLPKQKENLSELVKNYLPLKPEQSLTVFDKDQKLLLQIGSPTIIQLGNIAPTSQLELYAWLPDGDMAEIKRWSKGLYFIETSLALKDQLYTKIMALPAKPLINDLNQLRLQLLSLLLAFFSLGISIAYWLTHLLSSPLGLLNNASRTMADNLSQGYPPKLPQMHIADFIELAQTQTQMAETILSTIKEINTIKDSLALRVKEQTTNISAQKKRLDDIIIATQSGTWEWDLHMQKVAINHIWAELIGYKKEELEPLNLQSWLKLIHPDDITGFQNSIKQHCKQKIRHIKYEMRMRHKAGHWVWLLVQGRTVSWQKNGRPAYISGTQQDINARKKNEQLLRDISYLQSMCIKKYAKDVIHLNILKFLLKHTDSKISFIALFPSSNAILQGQSELFYLNPSDRNQIQHLSLNPIPELETILPALSNSTLKESLICQENSLIIPIKGADYLLGAFGIIKQRQVNFAKEDMNNLTMIGSTIASVIEASNNMSKIETMATKDALTGVYNRFYFTSHLNQLWKKRTHLAKTIKFGIMMIDLNNFKKINDFYGHEFGDFIIKTFSERVSKIIKSTDLMARIGGDEFVILVDYLKDYTEPGKIAERIIKLSNQPYELNNKKIDCSASIGISCFPRSGESIDELLRNADLALYKAKKSVDGYCYFSNTLQAKFIRKQNLEQAIKAAFKNEEFFFVFQPQVNIKTQKIVGAEALVRWQYAKDQSIPIEECINTIEHMGLSEQLNIYIGTHIAKLFSNTKYVNSNFKLSINLSPFVHDLNKNIETLIKLISPLVLNNQLNIDFEITETSFMESEADLSTYGALAKKLKANGIGLSLDDFGIKYSSINRLFDCDFRTIKIDRSFVIKLDNPDYPSAKAIVKAIIDIAHSMNINLIAEGAESQAQVEILSQLGCEVIQGYFYYQPMPLEALWQLVWKAA